MKYMEKERAIELIYKSIPYSNQINELQLHNDHLRFSWRGLKFRLCFHTGSIDEIEDGTRVGSNVSILMEALLKQNS
jgi:hypothetical protein